MQNKIQNTNKRVIVINKLKKVEIFTFNTTFSLIYFSLLKINFCIVILDTGKLGYPKHCFRFSGFLGNSNRKF